MNLREAAQQALEALEMGCTDHDGNPVDLVGPAITALRAALEPVTTCHELYETACANATYKVIDYFCHTTACSDVNVTYIRKILDEFAEQAICCKGGDKLSLPFNHFPDVSKMVATIRPEVTVEPVATINEMETVEPVAWMSHESMRRLREGGNCKGTVPVHSKPSHTSTIPLYAAPPKREPLTDDEINNLELPPNGCTMRELVRVVERVHGIGGEE